MSEQLPELVTPEALAKRWSFRVETIRRWCREGKLPAARVGFGTKRVWRIDVDDAHRFYEGFLPRRGTSGASNNREKARG